MIARHSYASPRPFMKYLRLPQGILAHILAFRSQQYFDDIEGPAVDRHRDSTQSRWRWPMSISQGPASKTRGDFADIAASRIELSHYVAKPAVRRRDQSPWRALAKSIAVDGESAGPRRSSIRAQSKTTSQAPARSMTSFSTSLPAPDRNGKP